LQGSLHGTLLSQPLHPFHLSEVKGGGLGLLSEVQGQGVGSLLSACPCSLSRAPPPTAVTKMQLESAESRKVCDFRRNLDEAGIRARDLPGVRFISDFLPMLPAQPSISPSLHPASHPYLYLSLHPCLSPPLLSTWFLHHFWFSPPYAVLRSEAIGSWVASGLHNMRSCTLGL
jgi:hypothetical protein